MDSEIHGAVQMRVTGKSETSAVTQMNEVEAVEWLEKVDRVERVK